MRERHEPGPYRRRPRRDHAHPSRSPAPQRYEGRTDVAREDAHR